MSALSVTSDPSALSRHAVAAAASGHGDRDSPPGTDNHDLHPVPASLNPCEIRLPATSNTMQDEKTGHFLIEVDMFSMSSRIRQARVAARLTQAELARRLGVQRSAVTQWERDSGTHPSIAHLAQIACETCVHFEWLATGRGESQPTPGALDAAVTAQEYARDELESRALIGLRRVSGRRREAVVKVIELLAS